MKKLTITALATGAFFLVASTDTAAQDKAAGRNWGHWQLVSNVSTPRSATVQFYNSDGVLMHEEAVEGRKINIARRKVCRRLDDALSLAYQSWATNKAMAMDGKTLLTRRSKVKGSSCTATAQ